MLNAKTDIQSLISRIDHDGLAIAHERVQTLERIIQNCKPHKVPTGGICMRDYLIKKRDKWKNEPQKCLQQARTKLQAEITKLSGGK